MGRKICVFMVGLILMGLAGEVRAQENLDTLWTKRIEGDATLRLYDVAVTDNGNLLVVAYAGAAPNLGRYIFEYSALGELLATVALPETMTFNSISQVRETTEGYFEILLPNRIIQVSPSSEIVNDVTIPCDREDDYLGPNGRDYYRFISQMCRHLSGTLYGISGSGHEVHYSPGHWNFNMYGPYAGIYDLATNTFSRICFTCPGEAYTNFSHIVLDSTSWLNYGLDWDDSSGSLYYGVTRFRYPGLSYHSINVPLLEVAYQSIWFKPHVEGGLWTLSRPVIVSYIDPEFGGLVRHDISLDSNFQASHMDTDGDGLLYVFSLTTRQPRNLGSRIDVLHSYLGQVKTWTSTQGLDDLTPLRIEVLPDRTAYLVSWNSTGENRYLAVARTDTVFSDSIEPQPASVELLVEGPPAWGYRIHSGSYSQNQIIFQNLCGEARGNFGWCVQDGNPACKFTRFFMQPHHTTNSVSDTLWLTAPECDRLYCMGNVLRLRGVSSGSIFLSIGVLTARL